MSELPKGLAWKQIIQDIENNLRTRISLGFDNSRNCGPDEGSR